MKRDNWSSGRLSLAGVVLALVVLGPAYLAGEQVEGKPEPSPEQIFKDRLLPIFNSPNPSSCTQCHLAGVELKNYILPSHEKTFVSLRDRGLIDLDKPHDSTILTMIRKGKEKATLVQARMREAEYQAFARWIELSCNDPKLRNAPALPDAFVLQTDRPADGNDKLVRSFTAKVWSQRKRCASCHMPGGKNTAKIVRKYGQRVVWMKANPLATVEYLRTTKLINVRRPAASLLLTKPTLQVEHGGGRKMKVGDEGYRAFLSWLQEYAVSSKVVARPKPPPKTDRPVTDSRKFVELEVSGVKTINDNFKLRAALSKITGVKLVVIDRRREGPSKVKVYYEGKEPDIAALHEAIAKSGYNVAASDG